MNKIGMSSLVLLAMGMAERARGDVPFSSDGVSTKLSTARHQKAVEQLCGTSVTVVFHAPIAQLDRASAYGAEGWGFDSLWAHEGPD